MEYILLLWCIVVYVLHQNCVGTTHLALHRHCSCVVEYFAALHDYLLRQHDNHRQKMYSFVCSHSFNSHGPVSDSGCCWISGMTADGARKSGSVDATDLFPLPLVLPGRGFFGGIMLF